MIPLLSRLARLFYDNHMPDPSTSSRQLGNITRFGLTLVNSDLIGAAAKLWRLSRRVLAAQSREGMYEVLDFDVCLELQDTGGSRAVLHKRQSVRFLQNNILAYQDKVWGDGNQFAEYKCAPGRAVDRYREGHRWRVLISLRETKQAGDVEVFHIERTITNGFTRKDEALQIEIDHLTRQLTMSIVFPRERPPRRVLLIEQNSTRTRELGPEEHHTLPDGRQKVLWHTRRPHLFEAYIMQWEW